jgi:hypothetical protein
LGTLDAGTVIEPAGQLIVQAPIQENLLLSGGRVVFREPANTFGGELTSRGGTITIDQPGFAIANLNLESSTTDLVASSLGDVTIRGAGDLVYRGASLGNASLEHSGNLTIHPEGDFVLGRPLHFGGTLSIIGRRLTIQNADSLGLGNTPVQLVNTDVVLEANVVRDFSLRDSRLEVGDSGAVTGQLTFNGSSELVANAPLASSLQLDGFQTILRVGEVNGVIRGGGKLSFFRDQQPDPTVLNADNEYTGLTEINRGVVIVNAPRALGSPQVGTIVNSGQLQLNTTVDEPMTVTGSGHVRILASQPRLPVFAGYAERNSRGADSKISLEVDGEFDGTTVINQGELEVAASVQLESLVLRDFGRLSVRPEDSLTLDHEFEIRSGELNIEGAIRAPLGALRKTTASNATLFSLGDYDGDILIDQGVVIVQGSNGLGTSNGATIVASPATLILGGGITLAENIQLMNSVGFGYDGGLHYSGNANILTGPLELGDHGSRIVGGSGAWMHVEGPIHGGDLVSDASEDFSVLVLKSNANTYNGSTILRGGTVAIGGEGQLTTTTEIVVSNGATLALQNWEQNRPDRIADHIPIVMQGGLIRMDGGSREEFSETMGELRVAQGAARIEIAGDQDATNRFTFARLTREPGTTIEFEVLTDEFASGRDHTVHFQTAPALTNGILGGWAVVGDRGHPQLIGFATYDANGVGLMAATSTNLLSATATDHVRVRTNTTLAGNKTIASLLVFDLNSHVDLNLGGHLLTVESGGVIAPSARILEGQITAGSQSGQELIVQGGGEFLATVVDNQSGPVNLTFVGRGALLGTNEHTGLTQLLGNSSVLSHVDLSPMAIPAGGDLVLDRVQVREVGEASRSWELGRLEVRGRSNVSFSRPVSFEQFDLIEGEVSGPLVGTGVLRKSGLTEASLYANLREFNGQVIVEEGRLITSSDVLNSASVVGGILRLRATHGRQNVDLTLGGGTVELGGSDLGGTMDIMAPTTIHLIEGDVLLRSELTGSSPLRISGNGRGRMEVAFRSDQPPTFSGPFSVENATLSMPAGAWGTGKIQVLKEGAYHPSLIQFDPAEPSSLQNDVELHDGIMIVSSGQVPGGGIDGELTVKGISLLGLRDSADILALRGPVRLEDSATLQLNGFGNISFEGPILVGANASIDARVRDYHSFRPAGQVQFAGPITANAPNASLDLIAVGVAVNTSLNIPAGQSLQVRLNGQPVAVTLDQPTEFMEGNGSLDNDVILSHGGRITPGSSVGTLTVLGNAEFSDGGVYAWELSDAAAASNGWDQVHIDGTLSVSARSDAPFLIQLAGLDPQGNAGAPLNFDSAKSATWLIAAAEQIDGWTDHNIVVDAASLESHVSVAADRRWYVSPRHGGLHLTYLVPSEIDSIQDADERELFVREMLRTWFGDANLDGQFSSSDLVQVFTLGQYEDSVAGNSTWRSGDWNGDGDFGSSDLVVAFQDGGYEQGNRLAVAASVAPASASLGAKPIPEPTSLSPLAWLITSLLVRRLKKHP